MEKACSKFNAMHEKLESCNNLKIFRCLLQRPSDGGLASRKNCNINEMNEFFHIKIKSLKIKLNK